MRLTVVIPHHRQRDLLQRALAAVRGWPVLVVDDSKEGLPAGLLEVPSLRTAGGTGFARAANAGLAAAERGGADLVLLLNDDAEVEAGCVAALGAAWGPGVGAVGPVIAGPQGVEAGYHLGRGGRVRAWRSAPPTTASVDGLSGACLLVAATERFDPAFRHGMEDLELCRRLRRRGLAVLLEPRARCRHDGGATVHRASPAAQRHAVSGHLRLVGGGLRTPLVLALAAAQVVREGGPVARFGGVWRGWRDWRGR